MKRKSLVQDVRQSKTRPQLCYTVHVLPPSFRRREVETVFARAPRDVDQPLHAVITFQQLQPWSEQASSPSTGSATASPGDMIEFTAGAAEWKDTSRDEFLAWVADVQRALPAELSDEVGHTSHAASVWIDAADPATGLAVSGACASTIYSEIDGIEQLLLYDVVHVGTAGGGCRMVSHPKFGLDCYPATLFAACPTQVLLDTLATL
jgi:hypothetical protein